MVVDARSGREEPRAFESHVADGFRPRPGRTLFVEVGDSDGRPTTDATGERGR